MTTLTDAVARAIRESAAENENVNNWKPEARAAIAEFCRYLRDPTPAMIRAVDAVQIKAHKQYQEGIYTPWTEDVLRALATHIEREGK